MIKHYPKEMGNCFPKHFIISNVFLIKITVVVHLHSSQQRDSNSVVSTTFFYFNWTSVAENSYGVSTHALWPWTIPYL